MKAVCLPPPRQSLQPGVACEIAGYGKEKQGEEERPPRAVTAKMSWSSHTSSAPSEGMCLFTEEAQGDKDQTSPVV